LKPGFSCEEAGGSTIMGIDECKIEGKKIKISLADSSDDIINYYYRGGTCGKDTWGNVPNGCSLKNEENLVSKNSVGALFHNSNPLITKECDISKIYHPICKGHINPV